MKSKSNSSSKSSSRSSSKSGSRSSSKLTTKHKKMNKQVIHNIKIGKLNHNFKRLFIKYSVLSSVITYVVAIVYLNYVKDIISCILDPFLSLDLNDDGKPDLKQLKDYKITINKYKIPIGLLIYSTIVFILNLIVLYYLILFIMTYIIS